MEKIGEKVTAVKEAVLPTERQVCLKEIQRILGEYEGMESYR